MDKAILLTGFNNWGKTTHINNLFGRQRFYLGARYSIPEVNASFTVESHSNDDYSEERYCPVLLERIQRSPDNGQNLFTAFCPTRQQYNDSRRILTSLPLSQYAEIHLFFLRFKWDHHAELMLGDVQAYLAGIANIHFFIVDADVNVNGDLQRRQARETQIKERLQMIFS